MTKKYLPRTLFAFSILLCSLQSCMFMPGHGFSEINRADKAGNNLGFEVAKDGLPVNWFFKTERVINNMSVSGDVVDFDAMIDSSDAHEGRNSLRFVIRQCKSTRENMRNYAYYPGIFHEFDAIPGKNYKVHCWVKNQGCDFELITSAVREMGGPACPVKRFESHENYSEWTEITLEQPICVGMKFLRIELNVKSPGSFQIDGIAFEPMD